MDVSRWMTKSVLTIKPHDTLRHARERLAKYRINQLPVVVNDKLVGIVTDRDIRDAYPSSLRLLHGKDIDEFGDSHTVEEVMTYLLGDRMGFCQRQVRVYLYVHCYMQSVADPARTHISDSLHPWNLASNSND